MIAADSLLTPLPTRPDVTRAVCRGASRHLRALGYAVVKEMTFANGRRGNIVALSPSGGLPTKLQRTSSPSATQIASALISMSCPFCFG